MKRHARWLIICVMLLIAAISLVELWPGEKKAEGPVIRFWGAARKVGGSCLIVENEGTRFIVDCGALGEQGSGALPPEPDSLAFMILTHAHIDHSGLIPELFQAGFKGRIYCTKGTAELAPIMLGMMRGISRDKIPREIFDRALASLVPVPFGETVTERSVSFRFLRAEHLLGAASVDIHLASKADTVSLLVSGDIGGGNSILLPPLERPDRAEYVVMESTYGGTHRDSSQAGSPEGHEEFAAAIGKALGAGGDVLVPSFTLGRTQEAIAVIDDLLRKGVIPPETEVFVDSPTARKITDVYRSMKGELSDWAQTAYPGEALRFATLREVRSRTSLKVHDRRHRPAIFISSSGDLSHANSPRHLMRMFSKANNLLCIIGWQAPGSVGERLLAGDNLVLVRHQEGKKVKEDWISPAMTVKSFHSFSAHADADGLLEWLGAARGVKRVFIVHGEEDAALALARSINATLGIPVTVPMRGDGFVLSPRKGAIAKSFPARSPVESDAAGSGAAAAADSLLERDE
ncbi:MAG: MBL fold metallo-hydrolase [Candidatus Krumholzibacteria bacterium]|nr:MBL fold metallo-hydrolase [Candidatus Krumholzibacteria bacterium]